MCPGASGDQAHPAERHRRRCRGRWFATTEVTVAGIGELAGVVGELSASLRLFLIRGRLIEGRHLGRVRRLDPDRKPAISPIRGMCAAVGRARLRRARAARRRRPGRPRRRRGDCRCAIGRAVPPGELLGAADERGGHQAGGRIGRFDRLDRPASGAELKRWLGDVPGLDTSTLNDVSRPSRRPIFDGVADPVPVRSRLIPGELDEVAVPDLPAPPPRPVRPAAVGAAPAWRAAAAPMGSAERYAAACLRRLALAPEGARHPTCVAVAARLLSIAESESSGPRRRADQGRHGRQWLRRSQRPRPQRDRLTGGGGAGRAARIAPCPMMPRPTSH